MRDPATAGLPPHILCRAFRGRAQDAPDSDVAALGPREQLEYFQANRCIGLVVSAIAGGTRLLLIAVCGLGLLLRTIFLRPPPSRHNG